MPAAILKHLVVATALMSAAMTASALTTSSTTFSDQELQAMLAQSRPVQSDQTAEPTSKPRLRIGLSDAMGWNMPHQVERTLEEVKKRWPSITDRAVRFSTTT